MFRMTPKSTRHMRKGRFSLAIAWNMAVLLVSSLFSRLPGGRTGLKKMEWWVDSATGREVVIIPLVHIGSEGYFEEIRHKLDELKAAGFVVFYEGVMLLPPARVGEFRAMRETHNSYDAMREVRDEHDFTNGDLVAMEIVYRKFRRVAGFHFTNYTNPRNDSLPRRYRNGDYVDQTAERLGLIGDRDIWVDLTLPEMIEGYEKHKGVIELDAYDLSTPLMSRYKGKGGGWYMVYDMRNEVVMNAVRESPHDKIVLLYGKAHMKWFSLEMKRMGYRRVK